MMRQLMRWGSERQGARKSLPEIASRDVWAVPWTPGLPTQDNRLEQILELTRIAPSWANTQPWHFVTDDNRVIATVERTPQRGNVREGKPYYRLDGGIAMCHFHLAAQAQRWRPALGSEPTPSSRHHGKRRPYWRVPNDAEQPLLRASYGIPSGHDILGVYCC
jgi:hypothetical protein